MMFVCDCCCENVWNVRPILRASGHVVRVADGSYAHVVGVERLCEGCDESLNECAVEDIAAAFTAYGRN
jgi:hypothetical protein